MYTEPEDDDLDAIAARDAQPDELPAEVARARAEAASRLSPVSLADQEEVEVPCCICGKPAKVMACIIEAIARWNRTERDRSEASEQLALRLGDPARFHSPEFIHKHEISTCPDCKLVKRAHIQRQGEIDHATTVSWLRALANGEEITREGDAWLRRAGYEDRLIDYYIKRKKEAPKS